MSIYKGKPAEVFQPIEQVYRKISDIGSYQSKLEALPAEAREKLGDVRFTDDAIIINTAPVGEIRFEVTHRHEPDLVKLAAAQSPVPFGIAIHLESTSPEATKISSEIDVDIPMMLRPMVGGKLQEAADKFSELITVFFA
ncbi:MAG: hypothetical protein NC043_09200 [Muribaculaceae bacterium]|nr:hypothetical protein [Muribaculaceae bacterium]